MAEVNSRREVNQIAEVLKVIGHPIRLRIMLKLAKKFCCVGEIWESLQLPQAVVSQHLKILKERGVLEARREGTKVSYLIKDSMIRDLVTTLDKKCCASDKMSA